MRRSTLASLSLLALLCLPPAICEAREPPKVVAGFVTSGRIQTVEDEAGEEYGLVVPSGKKLDYAWSDEPMVVHVPFRVPAGKGQPLRIVILLGVNGFAYDDKGPLGGSDAASLSQPSRMHASLGLCALSGSKGVEKLDLQEGYEWESIRDTFPLKDADPPCLVWMNEGEDRPRTLYGNVIPRCGSSEDVVRKGARIDVLVPPDANAGTYAFWIVVPQTSFGTRSHPFFPEVIEGRFRASVFTVASSEYPGEYEVQVAAGLEKQRAPDDPNLSLWGRLPDVETPFRIRTNGWVLDESKVRAADDTEDTKRELTGAAGSFRGTAAHIGKKHEWTTSYRVNFPQEVQDGGVAGVEISGHLEVPHCPASEPWGPWGFRFLYPDAAHLSAIGLTEAARFDEAGKHKSYRLKPLLDDDRGRRWPAIKSKEEWLERRGKAWEPVWVDPIDWGGMAPGERAGVIVVKAGLAPYASAPMGMGALVDEGPWALFFLDLEEVGWVCQTYRRKSAVESNEKGAPVVVTPGPPPKPHSPDGLEQWYAEVFCPLSEKMQHRLHEFTTAASLIGSAIAANRKHLRILKDAMGADSEHFGQEAWNKAQKHVTNREYELRHQLAGLRETVEDAKRAVDEVLVEIKKQKARSSAANRQRPELERWRAFWDDTRFRLPLELYASAGDLASWEAEMSDRDAGELTAKYRLELANMYLDGKRYVPALETLRSLVRVFPDEPEAETARRTISQIETRLLREVATKVQGEVHQAREKFYRWLEGRGLPREAPTGLFTSGLEHLWTVITTGPGAFASWLVGRADAMEEESRTVQEAGLGLWMGVQALIALTQRGVTLEEVPKRLAPHDLRKTLGLAKASGVEYSDADYRGLGSQILAAYRLPEIEALRLGSEDLFRIALGESHFELEDLDLSEYMSDRWEYAFDILSVKNQAMILLPMSVGTIGGKLVPLSWRPWGMSVGTNPLKAAHFLGKEVRTGQEVFAAAIGWEAALARVGTSKAMNRCYEVLESVHESGGLVWKATWAASPLAADLVLMTGIVHVADKWGGPRVAAAVEAVVSTALLDPSLCASLLARSRTTPAMLQRVAKRYGQEVDFYAKEAGKTRKYLLDVQEALRAKRAAGGAIKAPVYRPGDAAGMAGIRRDLSMDPAIFVPGSNMVSNQGYAAHRVRKALAEGDLPGARAWTDAASHMDDPARRSLSGLEARRKKLREALARLEKEKVKKPFQAWQGTLLDLSHRPVKGPAAYASLVEQGDVLRLAGDFEGAAKKYRAAIVYRGRVAGQKKVSQEMVLKLDIVERAAKRRKALEKLGRDVDLPDLDAADYARAAQGTKKKVTESSLNEVWECTATDGSGRKYAMKKMSTEGGTPDYMVEWQVRSEVAAAELGDLFGVCVPPCQGQLVFKDGKVFAGVTVTPWIPSPELKSESIGELLAIKDQFADHRVFSMILGDYDRHLGNYRMVKGRLVGMDAGQGFPQPLPKGMQERVDDEVLGHYFTRDDCPNNLKMLEQSLTWQDLKPAVERAETLFTTKKGEIRRRLQKGMNQLYPDDPARAEQAVNEAVQAYESRFMRIQERLKEFNQRSNFSETGKVFTPKGSGRVEPDRLRLRRPAPTREPARRAA